MKGLKERGGQGKKAEDKDVLELEKICVLEDDVHGFRVKRLL